MATTALLTEPAPPSVGRSAARLVGATKLYDSGASRVTALDNVDLELAPSQWTAIMGPSGSGKSTLMHCMAGLDQLSGGQAFIGDANLTAMSDDDLTLLRRSRVGFVFQTFNLIPTLTAAENIALPLSLSGSRPDSAVLEDVMGVLDLASRLHHRPAELSGGQQQRVAVARALVSEPDIVFADEPTGNLDSHTGTEILSFLRNAVDERGQTTVMVTHDPVAAAWADRVVFLVDGQISHEMFDPDADRILDVMKNLGR